MTDSEKKILEGFLSKTLKIDSEGMSNLYNADGELTSLDIAAEADASRITKLKGDSSDQFKRGLKEGASKIEKAVKDKYEVESELQGVELIDHVLSTKIDEVKGAGEDITKHPEFVKMQIDKDKALKAKDKEWQLKLDEAEKNHKKQSVFNKVRQKALDELDAMKPILPEDTKKAQKWKDKFIEEFTRFEYQEQEDGEVVIMKNNEPVKDSHGYSKSFTEHVKETASEFFDFQTAENRSSSGNQQGDPKKELIIKSDEDYLKASQAAKTPEERIKALESYEKNKQK